MDEKKPRRFWSKVDVGEPTYCWEWLAHTGKDEYGQFWLKRRIWPAHHVAWILTYGPIPKRLTNACILQICGNQVCCNPSHLFPGSRSEASWLAKQLKKGKLSENQVPTVLTVQKIHAALMNELPDELIMDHSGVSLTILEAIKEGHLWDWVTGRGHWANYEEWGWTKFLTREHRIGMSYNYIGKHIGLPEGDVPKQLPPPRVGPGTTR